MGTINYDVAALCILVLNFYLFFSRSRLYIMATRIFFLIILATSLATVMDILTVVMYWDVHTYHRSMLYAANMLYYAFQNTIPFFFILFLLALSGKIDPRRTHPRKRGLIPWLASMLLILSTPVTGWVFSFGQDGVYQRGPLVIVLYAIASGYTLVGLLVFYLNRMRVPRETRFAILLFLPFALLTFVIQFFIPELLIQNLGIALSALIVLLTVQDFGKYTDQVTNLFNRNGLLVQLGLLLQKQKYVSVFLVSLDNVNFLRLVLGPESFSALEREISGKIFGSPREDRFAALVGQGRFILVLGDRARIDAEKAALVRAFSTPWPFRDRLLTVSARICEVHIPEDTPDSSVLFQVHHELARVQERYPLNTIIPFSQLALANTERHQTISRIINRALLNESFSVVFQPIISVKTGKTIAAEALLRLVDDAGSAISPVEFIPVAEQTGAIHRIGDMVIRKACQFLRHVRSSGFTLGMLEVNLSPIQCLQPNLSQRIVTIIQEFSLEPHELCFEITETAANRSPAVIKRNLDSLVTAGFCIAVDDFGTGYSNITGLMDLPFRIVKLDRSLIVSMDRSENGRLGLEGVVAMFKKMNTELVAEGVETEEQAARISAMNIEYIQGFYYSRPLSPDQFLEYLDKEHVVCTG